MNAKLVFLLACMIGTAISEESNTNEDENYGPGDFIKYFSAQQNCVTLPCAPFNGGRCRDGWTEVAQWRCTGEGICKFGVPNCKGKMCCQNAG